MTEQEQPAYTIATLALSDLDAFMRDYDKQVFSTVIEAGGEVLIATPMVDVLEGNYNASWTAITKFPPLEALKTWYRFEHYQTFVPIRQSLSNPDDSILTTAPSFAGIPARAQ